MGPVVASGADSDVGVGKDVVVGIGTSHARATKATAITGARTGFHSGRPVTALMPFHLEMSRPLPMPVRYGWKTRTKPEAAG